MKPQHPGPRKHHAPFNPVKDLPKHQGKRVRIGVRVVHEVEGNLEIDAEAGTFTIVGPAITATPDRPAGPARRGPFLMTELDSFTLLD